MARLTQFCSDENKYDESPSRAAVHLPTKKAADCIIARAAQEIFTLEKCSLTFRVFSEKLRAIKTSFATVYN